MEIQIQEKDQQTNCKYKYYPHPMCKYRRIRNLRHTSSNLHTGEGSANQVQIQIQSASQVQIQEILRRGSSNLDRTGGARELVCGHFLRLRGINKSRPIIHHYTQEHPPADAGNLSRENREIRKNRRITPSCPIKPTWKCSKFVTPETARSDLKTAHSS